MMTRREILAILALEGTPGWVALVSRAEVRLTTMRKAMMDPSKERQEKLPDDYLRGQIEALEWLITLPQDVEREDERATDEERERRRHRDSADLIARVGATFPGAAEAAWR